MPVCPTSVTARAEYKSAEAAATSALCKVCHCPLSKAADNASMIGAETNAIQPFRLITPATPRKSREMTFAAA